MSVEETYHYLGLQIGANYMGDSGLKEGLIAKLQKLQKVVLNFGQKLHGLHMVMVPGVYHELSLGAWKKMLLALLGLNREILCS